MNDFIKHLRLAFSLIHLLVLFSPALLAQNNNNDSRGSELLIQANRATLERKYDLAIDLYGKYINLHPTDFRGYFNRGTTLYNAEKYSDARKDFNKTIELNPIYKEAYYYRGKTLVGLKMYELAIKDYTHVLQDRPRSVVFLKERAAAHTAAGNHDEALADLDKAVEINKLSGDLYKQRAELKVDMDDINGAIRDYTKVEKLIPAYKMVHYIKGNLYLKIRDTEFACEEFQKALDNRVMVAERVYNEHCVIKP